MKKKSWVDNRIIYLSLVVLLLIGALFGLIKTASYIGYTMLNATAGTITEIIIDQEDCTHWWAAYYGLAIIRINFSATLFQVAQGCSNPVLNVLVFDCLKEEQYEIYASLKPTEQIDWASVVAATPEDVDNYTGYSDAGFDSAAETFTQNLSITLGERVIWAPGTYLKQYGNPFPFTPYKEVILKDSTGTLIFAAEGALYGTYGFSDDMTDYQIMLAVPNGTTPTYYFMRDPFDICPFGFGTGEVGDGIVYGHVWDNSTGLSLENVSVYAGASMTYTNASGNYSFTPPIGMQYVIGIKDGYEIHVDTVNITTNFTRRHDFSMIPGKPYLKNGTVHGFVLDSATGLPLANINVSVFGVEITTDATGEYNITILEGTHNIVALGAGYAMYAENITIITDVTIEHNITMTAIVVPYGTVIGYVTDALTNLSVPNATVTIAGNSNLTDANGLYNITVYEGMYNIVAVKTGYDNYIGEVNVSAGNITVHNFSMILFKERAGENGTITGTVRNSIGAYLENVSVSIAGKSIFTNSTGEYYLRVLEGAYNLVATKSGYNNYFSAVVILAANITIHNITMNLTPPVMTGTGTGTGAGAGEGAGAGGGAFRQVIERPAPRKIPEEYPDHEISLDRIIKKLRIGAFLNVPVKISNFREEPITIRMSIEGDVASLIQLDKTIMNIGADSGEEFTVTILGRGEPGVYEGTLIISGDIEADIPVIILLYDRDKLPIEALLIKLKLLEDKLYREDTLRFRVDIQNLLREEEYDIKLDYMVVHATTGKKYLIDSDQVKVKTSFSLLKTFPLSADFDLGEYTLSVEARYLEFTSKHSAIFKVVEPFYRYTVLGIVPLWIILLVIALIALITSLYLWYKKKRAEKQRYKMAVDMDELPKPGPRAAFVGNIAETRKPTYFDLDKFQIHTLIAGASGSGKTVAAQALVEEALLKDVAVIVFDPTAIWTGFLRKLQDKKLLSLYPDFGMKKAQAKAFNGNVHQVTDGRQILEFEKYMKPGEINIFVTNKLDTKGTELLVANTIREVFRANLAESPELKYLLIYDGIHTLLPKFGGSGKVFVQIERATREFRKWGVGIILVSQVLSDFPPEVLANINTEVQMRTRDEGDLNRIKEEYGDNSVKSLVKASVGTGMIENAAYNKGKPYFISFRPVLHNTERLKEEDLENYNKYNQIIDDIEYELEQLSKEDIDIFDLELELKLAKDKVKSGAFNMVDIYLDGLKPRIKAQWDKLGKKPKKREIKLADTEELEEGMKKTEKKEVADKEEIKEGVVDTEELKKEIKEEKTKKLVDTEELKKEMVKAENSEETQSKNKKETAQHEKAPTIEKGESKEDMPEMTKLAAIKKLIDKAKKHIAAKEKEKASSFYKKIMEDYKTLPKQLKAELLEDCLDLRNKLTK